MASKKEYPHSANTKPQLAKLFGYGSKDAGLQKLRNFVMQAEHVDAWLEYCDHCPDIRSWRGEAITKAISERSLEALQKEDKKYCNMHTRSYKARWAGEDHAIRYVVRVVQWCRSPSGPWPEERLRGVMCLTVLLQYLMEELNSNGETHHLLDAMDKKKRRQRRRQRHKPSKKQRNRRRQRLEAGDSGRTDDLGEALQERRRRREVVDTGNSVDSSEATEERTQRLEAGHSGQSVDSSEATEERTQRLEARHSGQLLGSSKTTPRPPQPQHGLTVDPSTSSSNSCRPSPRVGLFHPESSMRPEDKATVPLPYPRDHFLCPVQPIQANDYPIPFSHDGLPRYDNPALPNDYTSFYAQVSLPRSGSNQHHTYAPTTSQDILSHNSAIVPNHNQDAADEQAEEIYHVPIPELKLELQGDGFYTSLDMRSLSTSSARARASTGSTIATKQPDSWSLQLSTAAANYDPRPRSPAVDVDAVPAASEA